MLGRRRREGVIAGKRWLSLSTDELAVERGQIGAAITAEHKRGFALGFYVERRADVAPAVRSAEQLKQALKQELAEIAADQAIAKAKQTSEGGQSE